MSAAMWCAIDLKLLHQWMEVAVIIITILEVFAIRCVDKISAFRIIFKPSLKQMDYEKANERVKEANERADRIETYIKNQSNTLMDLDEKVMKLERRAEVVYDMARGSGGNETLRDKLIDVMYENEQLKTENSKLRETLNKAYDFMEQFVVDGRKLLERFWESIGQVLEEVGDGFRR